MHEMSGLSFSETCDFPPASMQMSVGKQGLLHAEKRVTVCVLFRFRLDLDWQVDEVGCSPPPPPPTNRLFGNNKKQEIKQARSSPSSLPLRSLPPFLREISDPPCPRFPAMAKKYEIAKVT